MQEWAQKLVQDHKTPLINPELPPTKLLIPSGSKDEINLTKKTVEELFKVVDKNKVERRCSRSEAQWDNTKRLAKVTRNIGHINNFGFGKNNEKFLYPEEALFLIEINRLELLWNDTPLSLERSYTVLLDSVMTVAKYKAYKQLVQQGHKLVRRQVFEKRKKDQLEASPSKRAKLDHEDAQPSCSHQETENELLKKLKGLRELGPKTHKTEIKINYDYKVFLPENHSRLEPDYNLYISEANCWRPEMAFLDNSIDNLLCFAGSDTPAIYQIGNVDLPFLH